MGNVSRVNVVDFFTNGREWKNISGCGKMVMLIGFSGKNGSGKSTLARKLWMRMMESKMGVTIEEMSFAKKVKDIAKDVFFWDGEKDYCGRHLLQWLGTDVGRDYDADIWIKHLAKNIIDTMRGSEVIVIIDDVRFDNEAQWIVDNGGLVFGVDRECKTQLANHASEAGIDKDLITETLDMNEKFLTPEVAVDYIMEQYFTKRKS